MESVLRNYFEINDLDLIFEIGLALPGRERRCQHSSPTMVNFVESLMYMLELGLNHGRNPGRPPAFCGTICPAEGIGGLPTPDGRPPASPIATASNFLAFWFGIC